ncbi:MAG: hypothetical protein ABI625_26620 [bacterium]
MKCAAFRAVLGATIAFVTVEGCHGRHRTEADDAPIVQAAASDTVRGIVSVVGSEPMTEVVLTPIGGGAPLAVSGAQKTLLRGLGGIEVMVRGRRTGEHSATATPRAVAVFDVDSFVVRAVDGVAATDGIVAEAAGRFYLVVRDGTRLSADHLPAVLQRKVGARVFVAGLLAREAASYGVITERP